jgi:hypothetical protein
VLSAYHVRKDAKGDPVTADVKAEPRASALTGDSFAIEDLRRADDSIEWLTYIHKQSNGPYLFLCAGMGPLLQPKLSAGYRGRFKRWTDLYICLCLRKVALDINRHTGSSHMPLFVLFDGGFDQATTDFLQAQHFVAIASNFVWPEHKETSAKPGTNDGIRKVIDMIHDKYQSADAQVRVVPSTTKCPTSLSRNGSSTPSGTTVPMRCPSFLSLHASPAPGLEEFYKLLALIRDGSPTCHPPCAVALRRAVGATVGASISQEARLSTTQ